MSSVGIDFPLGEAGWGVPPAFSHGAAWPSLPLLAMRAPLPCLSSHLCFLLTRGVPAELALFYTLRLPSPVTGY